MAALVNAHNKDMASKLPADIEAARDELSLAEMCHHQSSPPRPQGLGNPAPLGLLGFGMTTVMLMFITTRWSEDATLAVVLGFAAFLGGLCQLIAGIFELIKGNTFAGTAFSCYGAFWMAFFVTKHIVKTSTAALGGGAAAYSSHFQIGETLVMALWGVFTTLFFVPTLRKNLCLVTVFGSLAVTFFLLAGGQWSATCMQAAGYVGFVCGCSAIYTAFAEIYEESLGISMPGLRPVRFI